jgi:N6-L-threonylcarbamoyladenine synthase
MLILSIETSCDETAAAVTKNGREVLSSVIYSQIALHKQYGGVVPEIASRRHIETIAQIVDNAVSKAGISKQDLDAVAVTAAPGLIGALLTGLSFAKSAAYALGIPLIPVHHIKGHIASNYIAFPELKPPFICAVVSGGHTLFIDVTDYDSLCVLGSTRDDAAGEAFDKVARALGFPYPGGRELDALAGTVPDGVPLYPLPKPSFQDAPLDCSFSGLKTAVINMLNSTEPIDRAVLAKSTTVTIANILVERAILSAKLRGRSKIAIAGGVAANSFLRKELEKQCKVHGFGAYIPPVSLCGDNAAMIGCAGYYSYLNGVRAPLSQNAFATMPPEQDLVNYIK